MGSSAMSAFPPFYSDRTHLGTWTNGKGRAATTEAGPTFHSGQQKRTAYMEEQGQPPYPNDGCPVSCGLASRADRLALALLFQRHRPFEHREGRGLGLATAALRLARLLGHELSPGEQRLLRLRGLVMVVVGGVAVPVPVGVVPVAQDQLDGRPDAACVVAVPQAS